MGYTGSPTRKVSLMFGTLNTLSVLAALSTFSAKYSRRVTTSNSIFMELDPTLPVCYCHFIFWCSAVIILPSTAWMHSYHLAVSMEPVPGKIETSTNNQTSTNWVHFNAPITVFNETKHTKLSISGFLLQ